MQEVRADGNCLFRAIADQLDGDQNNHDTYRQAIVEYIIKCKDDFAPFVEDDVDFETYVEQMKEDAVEPSSPMYSNNKIHTSSRTVVRCVLCNKILKLRNSY